MKIVSVLAACFILASCSGNSAQSAEDLLTGYNYLKGTGGMEQNAAKATEFFLKAAKNGNRDAQFNVGLAYVRGEGVGKDLASAYEWFKKAALQDDAGAQYTMGVMAINGEGTVADPVAAYVWFQLASEKSYDGAVEGMNAAKSAMTKEQIAEIPNAYAAVSAKIVALPVPAASGAVPL